jgi:nitroreductase
MLQQNHMKHTYLFLSIALLLSVSAIAFSCSNSPRNVDVTAKDALSVIFNRKSVRTFTSQPVTPEEIQTLLKAGFSAPTAKNIQPWEFIVFNSRSAIDSLAAEGLPGTRVILEQAALAIVICGDTVASTRWSLDCSAATENILLAAEALGLGAVWLAVYPWRNRVERVVDVCGTPPHVLPLAVVAVGHPKGEHSPKNKYKEAKIHWNKW